jgi:alginate O-acetyltransferase complex protein AlgI
MVFHSYEFIFGFLPLVYLAFVVAHRIGGWSAAFKVLAAASVAFYAQWSLLLLVVLLGSVVFNYAAGELIMAFNSDRRAARRTLLLSVTLNLGALGYFKYSNFLIDIANQVAGTGYSHLSVFLPVGISFFTFVQIGYLVEAYNGQVERPGFGRYLLFATFFPCVTAGPLVLQREMFDQIRERDERALEARRLAVGLTMFGMGLFKKVVLADSIAPYANLVFDGVAAGGAVTILTAWLGALCYALQLYFDFSGYSDMAIGLGYMFGLKLPINFDSPFKATSISEFWRRWHMTMTRLFTVFIYTPMAMRGIRRARSRSGVRRFFAVTGLPALVTFLVAGAWHGAGWTFVVYGLIHGVAIATNGAWREFVKVRLPTPLCWAMTMSVVVSGLVVFRAPDLATATTLLGSMWLKPLFTSGAAAAVMVEIDARKAVALITLLGAIVLLLPNTQQILHRHWVSSDVKPENAAREAGLLAWRPSIGVSAATATAYVTALTSIGAASSFLYYQF